MYRVNSQLFESEAEAVYYAGELINSDENITSITIYLEGNVLSTVSRLENV